MTGVDLEQRSWTLRVEEDENGDAVLTLPPDLLAELGWKVGDTIWWHVEDGKIWITSEPRDPDRPSLEEALDAELREMRIEANKRGETVAGYLLDKWAKRLRALLEPTDDDGAPPGRLTRR